MGRITKLRIEGYRSIGDPIEIRFPERQPVVLMGENNAGKSNIVRALQLVLGPFWPGTHQPEDHEFFGRDPSQPMEISVTFDPDEPLGGRFRKIVWRYDRSMDEPIHFRGIDITGEQRHVRNDDRDTCMCMVVEAERGLNYHLSYSSKWTLLSRLMHRFHRALLEQDDVRGDLEVLFEQTKLKFHEVPEFKAFVEGLQREFDDLVTNMPHRLRVDFEAYNPVNFFHALRLQAAEEDEPRTLEEMGTGEQQVLALAFAYAYAKAFHSGMLLVIEEPEAHLHPLAQQWVARRLRSRCAEGLQVLITTHSPAFVSVEGLDGLVLVYKENGMTGVRQVTRRDLVAKCIETGVDESKVTEENILPFYAANSSSDLLAGFFARAVILVEGQTESLALPVLMAKKGLELDREGIAVLSVGGKGNLAKWYRLYQAYEIPCYIVFDNDSNDDRNGSKREDILTAVGVAKERLQGILRTDAWRVSRRYTVFGRDFETTMRAHFTEYAELEHEARSQGVETKPFVARWAVERLDPASGDSGWRKVESMIRVIRVMLTTTARAVSKDLTSQ